MLPPQVHAIFAAVTYMVELAVQSFNSQLAIQSLHLKACVVDLPFVAGE